MRTLTPRQQTILNRVIDLYIDTAQPVGSKHIAELFHELYRSTYSPATVRHEMGILEDSGYLTHPHTSAGRVPTDQGYRYYVHYGLRQENVEEKVFEEVVDRIPATESETSSLMDKACAVLSSKTNQICLILVPHAEHFGGPRFFLHGSSRLLGQPEFQDVQKAKALFQAIEEKITFVEWLSGKLKDQGITIMIGRENETSAFEDCAVLSSRLSSPRPNAIVSIIGPRRMHYGRNLPLVRNMVKALSRIFDASNQLD